MDNLLKEYQLYFESTLNDFFNNYNSQIQPITDAVKYGVVDGGKRVRPCLCYLTAKVFGKPKEYVSQLAIGVEMIHSYSLIHDDLPSMDNDTLRRGKPTAHIEFGEGMAVLAGDGLLNMAFEALLEDATSIDDIRALRAIANFAGIKGMIGGQCIDIQNNNKDNFGQSDILNLYDKKTSCLFNCAIVGSALKCGAST
ncbi:MAG: polyprenyl synthetase family protein, partial [Clostridia bacterium]